ncbi:MAG: hypothetical protein RBG1_1C00001G1292 [candidate division Zixibacteria bacterium RBG-1]|nr:MAG: hypothetical protein RBG1_1C00001G1292 [candidate division Zixibacteria bacterium RBG-1]OGC86704.1 MAG: hypothetical protein A2V73_06080 [candidate division Zixibacteria bacterium RBG_19FT_COMBO_42_43]
MPLYKIEKTDLERIRETPFRLEKELQRITENNLAALFKLRFIKGEFTFKNVRIDTLAFDEETKAFVIIEYKKDRNFSVIDQGFAYLSLMLNNKAEFIVEYNENIKHILKRNDVDWSQSRVIFISPSFSPQQVQAINFKDLPIELWKVTKYANDSVSFEKIEPIQTRESIKTISQTSEIVQKVSKEIKSYSEQDHLRGIPDNLVELYYKFKEMVLSIGNDIQIKPTKKYIAFKGKSNITDVQTQKSQLKIFLNLSKGKLNDIQGIARDVSKVGHWGNGDYQIIIKHDSNLDYIIGLVKQSHKYNS